MTDKEFLRYRIHSVSSQASPNCTLRLLDPQSSQGWVSAPSPTPTPNAYPQSLVIRFFLPIKTTSLSLLFHQYKIPSLVEVFIKEKRNDIYQRLGHIKPSNNQQTSFEQRELKTLYFEYPCSFIKLVMQEPYQNKYNVLRQVGIDEITVKGAILEPDQGWLSLNTITAGEQSSDEEVVGELGGQMKGKQELDDKDNAIRVKDNDRDDDQVNPSPNQPSLRSSDSSLPEIESILKILNKKKEEAVEDENYELASLLKTEILNVKTMESKLFQFQHNKKRALDNEDYDQAAQLRNQILKVKQTIQYELNRLTHANPNTNPNLSLQSPEPKHQRQFTSVSGSRTFLSQHESQVVSALANKLHQNQSQRRIPTNPNDDSKLIKDIKYQTKIIEELDSRTQMQIQKYSHIVPLHQWVTILNKNWKHKEEVLTELSSLEFQDVEEVHAILELCSFSIRDKHPTVIIETLKLLLRNFSSPAWNQIPSMPQPLVSIMNFLPPFMIDGNKSVRDLALECLLELPDLPCVSIHQVLSLILPRKSKPIKEIPKLTQVKVVLTGLLLVRYKVSHEQSLEILEWGIGLLEDPNQDIRTSASELIIGTLVPIVGVGVVVNKAKHIRPNILNSFISALNNSRRENEDGDVGAGNDKGQQSEHSKNKTESREELSQSSYCSIDEQNRSRRLDKNANPVAERPKSPGIQQQIKVFEYIKQTKPQPQSHQSLSQPSQSAQRRDLCDYCLSQLPGPDYDKSFQAHLFHCKMMTTCQQCSCLIYIRGFCDHLLYDCEKAKYHQCDRCQLAFPFSEFHSHQAESSCRERKKGYEKCQLCGKDVLSNDQAWIAHADYCK